MKKVLETLLAFVGLVALVLGGAENPDGSCNLAWTLSCIAVVALCGWLYGKLNPREGDARK